MGKLGFMALYKRKIYLINKPFQLKFSFYLAIIILISSAIYPLIIFDFITQVSQAISSTFPKFSTSLDTRLRSILVPVIAWQLFFSFLFFLIGIFFSHKIAGPIYKLQIFLKKLSNREGRDKLYFRDGDYFSEIATEYNKLVDELDHQELELREKLNQVRSELLRIDAPEKMEIVKKLDNIINKA